MDFVFADVTHVLKAADVATKPITFVIDVLSQITIVQKLVDVDV